LRKSRKLKDRSNDVLVCRCEDVNVREIKDAIRLGIQTIDGVKRLTRAGMGMCQGRTCRRLVEQLIAEETKRKIEKMPPPTKRPPVRPVEIGVIAKRVAK